MDKESTTVMLETPRLRLVPLSHRQLIFYLRMDPALERELQLNPSSREMSKELAEAMAISIVPNVANPRNNYLFYTLWTVVEKAHNRMVADLCFKGPPTSRGDVEIGYGTYPAYQGNGFMKEAVGALLGWVFQQPDVRAVVAETDKENKASIRILRGNGFLLDKETDLFYYWRLTKEAFRQPQVSTASGSD